MTKTLFCLLIVALLALNAHAAPAPIPCPLAPRSRLHIGDAAVVAPGIDVLNLRALPARSTGVQGRLYAGNALTIIGGASCNGGYTWWRVEAANGARGWVAEGTWEGYWVIPAADAARPADPLAWSCGVGVGSRRCIAP